MTTSWKNKNELKLLNIIFSFLQVIPLETPLPGVAKIKNNFKHFIERYFIDFGSFFQKLPKFDPFIDKFNYCLGAKDTINRWSNIVRMVANSTISKCYSYFQCDIKEIVNKCLNVKNNWHMVYQSKIHVVTILQSNTFVIRSYCSY